jgi:hypothetical protein
MEKSIKSIATNYGLYLGGFLALITVSIYAINLDLMVNMWLGIGLLILMIIVGVLSVMNSKKAQEGMISFKEAFTSYFITVVLGIVISTVVSAILYNLIDPEAAEYINGKTVEITETMMENFGAPKEAIAEAIEELENTNQYGIASLAKSVLWGIVMHSVIGLIIAAIMKRTDPDA